MVKGVLFPFTLLVLVCISKSQILKTTADPIPVFEINFDEHPSTRYLQIYSHFNETIAMMEDLFYHSVAPKYRDVFLNQSEAYKVANPHAYYAMEALSQIINRPIHQTLLVNSIVDFSSWCTSIVARLENGTIIHARNLDFDYTAKMQKLVYNAKYRKGGKIVAEAPSIAGYVGAYTGLKYNTFTVSYNVRIVRQDQSEILKNIQRELDGIIPTQQLIQNTLLEEESYQSVVDILENQEVNAQCFFIVGGLTGNEGTVIAKDPLDSSKNVVFTLSADRWFVAATNADFWQTKDHRYERVQEQMNLIGQKSLTKENLISEVLDAEDILEPITIFQASMSATLGYMELNLVPQSQSMTS